MNDRKWANGLGWFSIALGVTEVVAGKALARALGVRRPGLVRAFGVREVASGVGILTQTRKRPWILARLLGDAMDLALLGNALRPANRQRGYAALALAAVAPVVALDVVVGKRLG
jgi:hypothetical protein